MSIGQVSAWDMYLKIQEKSYNSKVMVPLNKVAEELGLCTAMAEEYSIALHLLDLVEFDSDRKEIVSVH